MPLFDLSYQRFEGTRTPRRLRAFAIARSAGWQILRKRVFLQLLALSWLPVVVRGVLLYLARQFPESAAIVSIDAFFWQEFLAQQVTFLPVVLVALYTGASSIASDLETGAFAIYLSKPISRLDYVMGRALPVAGALGAVTLVPALALLALHGAIAADFVLYADSPLLPLSVVAYSLWISSLFTLLVLAVSSLTRSGRVAGIAFVAVALGSKAVFAGALGRLGGGSGLSFLSVLDAAVDSSHVFFGTASSGDAPYLATAFLSLAMAAAAVLLARRLRSAEVST